MPNDQFFEDDDIILSFGDDVIEDIIPSVSVKEERFREDAILRLNKDQINSELTNLVNDRQRNITALKATVKRYADLFFSYPQVPHLKFKELRPVIYSDKLMYFSNEDEHSQNKEYEYAHFQKSEKLANFISQFHSINRDMSKQSYTQSANKLYALYAPFVNRDNTLNASQPLPIYTIIQSDVDAVRHCALGDEFDCATPSTETIRLLKAVEQNNVKLYDGDGVNVVGFYNHVTNDTNQSVPIIYNIEDYVSNVQSLMEGDTVNIVFNEPAFSSANKMVKTAKGKITNIAENGVMSIQLNAPTVFVKSSNKHEASEHVTYDPQHFNNGFFIYGSNTSKENLYHKSMLLKSNILFRFPSQSSLINIDIDTLKSFILPNSVGELIMLYEPLFSQIHNLHDLSSLILIPNGLHIDTLTADLYPLLTYVFMADKDIAKPIKSIKKTFNNIPYKNTSPLTDFNKHDDILTTYTQKYPSYDTFIDDALNRFRYLKSQNDKGAVYFLSLIKESLKKKYKKHVSNLSAYERQITLINKELDELDLNTSSSPTATNNKDDCEPKYAKQYKKLKDLIEDNGKTIYFDKKFDETNYAIRQGFMGNSTKELEAFVLNELMAQSKYKKMSKSELEFEIKSILSNKRKVRVGDIAVLHTANGDAVYTRQSVEDKDMWIKKFSTPFKVCTDSPLIKFNDLIRLDTCIKQTFDDVCRSNKNARVLYKYRLLTSVKTEVSLVISMLERYENIVTIIDTDIDIQKSILLMKPEESKGTRKFEYVEHVDYEEYAGVEGDVDETTFQLDFNERENFVIVSGDAATYPSKNQNKQSIDENHENIEAVNMFLSFIQIPIDNKEVSFVISSINAKFPKKMLANALLKYDTYLQGQINPTAYKNNEKYAKSIDQLIKQKMQKKEEELLKTYYFNIFRYIIGYIVILIFIRYPNYVMKVVLPSCVKLLSYMGYPISEKDGQRSLINYFSCLITSISVSEDIRFQLFYEKEPKEIQQVLKETVDDILDNNYELKTQLELTKSIIKKMSKEMKLEHADNDFGYIQGFKPHFKFGNIDKMNKKTKVVVNYIKTIQEIVERSKISKQTVLNVPNLVNACCTETLEKDTTFYKFFKDYNEFIKADTQVTTSIKVGEFVDENLHPPKKQTNIVNLFTKLSIVHPTSLPIQTNVGLISKTEGHKHEAQQNKKQLEKFITVNEGLFEMDPMLKDMTTQFTDTDWWIDVFYPHLSDEFNKLVDMLNKLSDATNKDTTEYLKKTLINLTDVHDVSVVRQVTHAFLSSKMRHVLGKIVNKQKLSEEMMNDETFKTNPLYMIIASVSANKNYDAVLAQFKQMLTTLTGFDLVYFSDTSSQTTKSKGDIVLQNVFLYAYLVTQLLKSFLFMTLSTNTKIQTFHMLSLTSLTVDATIRDKENLKLTCDIVNLLLSNLASNLRNTIADPSELKLSYEKLREMRKEDEIAKYKVDDEERELQMQLKKMGHSNWVNILNPDEDFEMSEEQQIALNPTQKTYDEYDMEQVEVFNSYNGENDEGDNDNDEDYVSYEAYNN
jgi:hypothetical protein